MKKTVRIINSYKADVITKRGEIDKNVNITVIQFYDRNTGAERITRIPYCYGVSVREENDAIYVKDKNGKEHKIKFKNEKSKS